MDTIAGRGEPPRLVLAYVRGLPDTSLYQALRQGGWEHYGWGQDRHMQADIYDALTFNTEATGQWSKTPSLGRWPRPETTQATDASTADEPKKPMSVKDLWNRLKK